MPFPAEYSKHLEYHRLYTQFVEVSVLECSKDLFHKGVLWAHNPTFANFISWLHEIRWLDILPLSE